MRKAKDALWELNQKGEIIYDSPRLDVERKYKADTPFDNAIVPYVIMIFCAAVDFFVFRSMFEKISYDSKIMMAVQIGGLLFGFDVVPIFIGIQYRRLKQGLSKDKFILKMALLVCALACALNVGLRIATIDKMSPDLSSSSNSYYGAAETETESANKPDSTAVALSVFGMVLPVVTSLGSCFISYLTYNPLLIRKKRLEEALVNKKDEARRFDAILSEYNADLDYAERIKKDDADKYNEIQKTRGAKVVGYCDYVRERIKEYMSDPTSTNILSKDEYAGILKRLDDEQPLYEKTDTSEKLTEKQHNEEKHVNLVTPVNGAAA